jgi:hypothetical protein
MHSVRGVFSSEVLRLGLLLVTLRHGRSNPPVSGRVP